MKRLQQLLQILNQKPSLDLVDVLQVLIVVREYYILESLKWQFSASIKTKFEMQTDVDECNTLINKTENQIRSQEQIQPVSREWLESIIKLCKDKTHDYSNRPAKQAA